MKTKVEKGLASRSSNRGAHQMLDDLGYHSHARNLGGTAQYCRWSSSPVDMKWQSQTCECIFGSTYVDSGI